MQAMARNRVFEAKTYIMTYLATAIAVATFSHFVAVLFGQTIPGVVSAFFKDASGAFILAVVFIFAFAWLLRARPHNRPSGYSIVVFDIYGRETAIEGLRTEFGTHDVAWSFMRQYKGAYPLNNFALVADAPRSAKRTIFRYL